MAGIQDEPGPQARPRSLPVRRPARPLRAGRYPCTPRRADRSIADHGAGAPNRKFISDQVTIRFHPGRGPPHARAMHCLRTLVPVRHVSHQQHHLCSPATDGRQLPVASERHYGIDSFALPSMLSAASKEPLELADLDATRSPHLMTAKRSGRIWIIQEPIAAQRRNAMLSQPHDE